jgi:Exo-beta-D-glucosaminidase Ig-fold domain/Glycosyl hydrolases family 2/Concanavalin A-like lectin/glucanases superfamily/Glycosyl hydrolases family 2, sugar binding domain/Glycosyl hydrolases family 2, TIM barrel domain
MRAILGIACGLVLFAGAAAAQDVIPTNDPPYYGPYNGVFLPDGEGLKKALVKNDTVTGAHSPWTLHGWIFMDESLKALSPIAGLGDPEGEYSRYLGTDGNKLVLWIGKDNSLSASASLPPGKWHFVAATFDGLAFSLFSDGRRVAGGKLDIGSVSASLQMAPSISPWENGQHFGGKIAGLTLLRRALSDDELKNIFSKPDNFQNILFEEGSKPWPFQTSQQAGYRAPQDPATMPRSKAPFSNPVKTNRSSSNSGLAANGKNEWVLSGAWRLRPAPDVAGTGESVSQSQFSTRNWWTATVPGTVLTTMIDQGVYPDPDYGLNNLAIPESLNKQDYWYRTEFSAPHDWSNDSPNGSNGRRLTLTFEGINYAASVWLNGKPLGSIKGAFIRGIFDVTEAIKVGSINVLAVRVSPPPHPGIPHEQSIKAGPGENGGAMCLDGPTFVDTEGWDWIPAIRDRDTGIWQAVTLKATSVVRLGDPQIVTRLKLPDTQQAAVEITVPLQNDSSQTVEGTLTASFENVSITKNVSATPGKNEIKLSPAEFPALLVKNPRLWWPNGYGKPELYTLGLSFSAAGQESDSKKLRFGIRELTYEISLLDSTGHLRRVDYSPTVAREKNEQIVDVTHEGIRNIPDTDPYPSIFPPEWKEGWKWWVASLKPGAEKSSAVKAVDDTRASPFLTIRVNGVRIAARGGSWGMDDSRKRVSREKLEPYFRLHRDANLNIIRNWVGQSTEAVFFDLADEYGLLVWNDFWASTQSYNVEPEDPQLFLENARDTILRFRNHPSIAIWCGRNEGVPQPTLNEGLDQLIRSLDGTRYYTPTSNQVNLQNSGPYKFVDPKLYFNMLNHGFSVETGTPSFPTLATWKTWLPAEDLWPISDDWAYHDWHMGGNGDMAPFMAEMEKQFGAATSLDDFERKAQMLNYVQHRAIFEGMNAHLWAPNTGRMLWMTQPAWPSSTWQILSSDYDTQASFYAVKKASEPLHVQLDPTTFQVQVANSLPVTAATLSIRARVYSLDNKILAEHAETKDAPTGVTEAFTLDLAPHLKSNVALVKLELRDSAGKLVSDNFYWLGGDTADYRKLNRLPAAQLAVTANATHLAGVVHVRLENKGNSAAIETRLTLLETDGRTRILPAYYGDNYISLLPGETRELDIEAPSSAGKTALSLGVHGWNVAENVLRIGAEK